MVNRSHTAWTTGHISDVLLKDINPAPPNVAKGRLVNIMKVRQMNRDLIQWTDSTLSQSTVEMSIKRNAMERHPIEAGVPHGSPLSLIVFAIYTLGLIKWVEQYVSAKELPFVHDLG